MVQIITQTYQLFSDLCEEVIEIIDGTFPVAAVRVILCGTLSSQVNSGQPSEPLSKIKACSALSLLHGRRGRGRRRGRWTGNGAWVLDWVRLLCKKLLENRSKSFIAREPSQRILWRWQRVSGVDREWATSTEVIVFTVLSPQCRLESTQWH